MSDQALLKSFVEVATAGRCEQARRLLASHPEIADDPWAALVLGRGFDGDASAAGGPLGWAPLLYVTHSCFASVELARALLERGADPNSTFTNEYGDMSALYGAAGVVHSPELTRLLLEAGADPDDGESVYHATEAPDPACLRLLLERAADTSGGAALAHALDGSRIEHVRLLLDHGADPNDGRWGAVVHAIRRDCGIELVQLLLERGADPNRRGGEYSTPRERFLTPYENAVLRNRDDVVALLEQYGAATDVSDELLAVAALARGEPPASPLPADLSPDAREVLILAALRGHFDRVVDELGVAFAGRVGASPPGTLLHHASWVGKADVVRRLLERGADPVAPSSADFDTPIAWAVHGSQYPEPDRDHVAVVEHLLAAGAKLEPRFSAVATGPLADWLSRRASTGPARRA